MMESNEALFAEIERVLQSPYPTELQASLAEPSPFGTRKIGRADQLHDKTLRNLLLQVDDHAIESWAANCEGDEIESLVEDVLTALPHWPYCVDIVMRLSSSVDIRNVILNAAPTLLHSIVEEAIKEIEAETLGRQATESHHRHGRYLDAATVLLSRPFPRNVAIPANCQKLMTLVAQRAAGNVKAENVEALRVLADGAGASLIESFSPDTLRRFEANVFSILRDASDVAQQSLALSCLSIMAVILAGTGQAGVGAQGPGAGFGSFFDGTRGHKTMQLVVLQVLQACGDHRHSQTPSVLQSTDTATKVLEAVDRSVRDDWCGKNASIVTKLTSKASSANVDPTLTLQITAFLMQLLPVEHIDPALIAAYQRALLDRQAVRLPLQRWGDILAKSLPKLQSRLPHDFLTAAIQTALHGVGDPATPPTTMLAQKTVLLRLLSEQGQTIPSEQITHLCSNAVTIARDLTSVKAVPCKARPALVQTRRWATELILLSMMRSSRSHASIDMSVMSPLFELHATSVSPPEFEKRRRRPPLPGLNMTADFELNIDVNATWQENIAKSIHQKSLSDQAHVLSAISLVCNDLEARCKSSEQPLREEQVRHEQLREQFDDLEQALGLLESQLVDRDLNISDLEAENLQMKKNLAMGEKERTELFRRIEVAQDRLQECQDATTESLSAAREEIKALEKERDFILGEKREQMNRMMGRERELQESEEALQDDLARAREQQKRADEAIASLISKIELLRKEAVDAALELAQVQTDHNVSIERAENLEAELASSRSQLKHAESEISSLQEQIGEVRTSVEKEKSRFMSEYREAAEQAHNQWSAERRKLEKSLDQNRQTVEEMESDHRKAIKDLEGKRKDSEKKIDKLRKECSKKDDQIVEAQEMRNRLMMAMGLAGTKQPEPSGQASLPIRSMSTRKESPPKDPRTPGRAQVDSPEGVNRSSSGASSQHEPTPRRTKPRKSFKIPVLQGPQQGPSRRSARSNRSSMAANRQPLAETPANWSPTRRKSPANLKVAFEAGPEELHPSLKPDFQELDGWSFTSDIISGTPGDGLGLSGGDDEETTLDC